MTTKPFRHICIFSLLASLLVGSAHAQERPPIPKVTIIPIQAPARPAGVQEMTLLEVLALGKAQNPQIQIAGEQVEQARATYLQAKSQKNPQLVLNNKTTIQPGRSINTDGLFENRRPANFPSRFTILDPVTDQFQLSLQKLLTTFGRVENEIAAAFLQIDVEAANADVTILDLNYSIKQAFFDKLKADAKVEVSRLNLSVANQNLDDTDALFEQGIMSRYDMIQSEIEVTRSVERLAQNLTLVDQAAANLNNVVAERAFLVQPVRPVPLEVDPEVETDQLTTFALANRPEIALLEANRAVADKLLDAARSQSNPELVLAANYQTAFGQSLAPVNVPSITLTIQWAIYDGGLRKAKVLQAESVLREISAGETQLVNNIVAQIQTLWLDLEQTRFNVATAQQQLKASIEYYDMAQRRYVNGLATTLEVSDALRNLINARTALVEAEFNRDLSFARLEQALGRDVPNRHLTTNFLTSTNAQETTSP